jgi:DNA-directed RNA polymerase subunit alpha
MEIWTNGTVSPQMAVVEGAKILRKHLNPFIQYAEPGPEIGMVEDAAAATADNQEDVDLNRKLAMSLAELELSVRATNCLESEGITTVRDLELSVRATNCLESEGITTVRDLVIRTDEELLEVRNFGETTLKEVKQKLAERGLHLGMKTGAKR